MHCPIFLTYCWTDSPGMLVNSVVTVLLMASILSKRIPLSLRIEKVTQSKIWWIERLFKYGDVFLGKECRSGTPNPITFLFSRLTITRTVNQRLPRTNCLTHSKLFSVLHVEGSSLLESSFTSSHPSFKLLCHSKTRVRNRMLSPYTCWSISSVCDGVFPRRTKSFRFICSSVLIAERLEKEAM